MQLEKLSIRIIHWIGSPQSLVAHTLLFLFATILLLLKVFPFDVIMLIWNTIVSLEAIYLSIFIQMSVNRTSKTLAEIEQDIEDIQEEVTED
jgi:low affinity Fe/Cu permease